MRARHLAAVACGTIAIAACQMDTPTDDIVGTWSGKVGTVVIQPSLDGTLTPTDTSYGDFGVHVRRDAFGAYEIDLVDVPSGDSDIACADCRVQGDYLTCSSEDYGYGDCSSFTRGGLVPGPGGDDGGGMGCEPTQEGGSPIEGGSDARDGSANVGCLPPPPGIVAWWTGDGTTADRAGSTGSCPTGGPTGYEPGEVGEAFYFDGSAGIEVAGAGLPTGSSPRTIEMWVRVDAATPMLSFVAGYPSVDSSHTGFFVAEQQGRLAAFSPLFSVSLAAWHHAAVSYDGGIVNFYVDGSRQSSMPSSVITYDTLDIGAAQLTQEHFTGAIDEVTVYDRALSDAEISAIYNAGSAGKCK